MKRDEESGQVHILEMVTLFWLFFMSAMFLIQIHIPDTSPISSDATLEMAAEDSIKFGLAEESLDGVYENRVTELLAQNNREEACSVLISGLSPTIDGQCWLARNSDPSSPYGDGVEPSGNTITVHTLMQVDSDAWTVTIDVWYRGGGL